MFDSLPKKHRPRCHKRDASGCCPKGVPAILEKNALAYEALLYILMNHRDAYSGSALFDDSFVKSITSLYEMCPQEELEFSFKVRYLVSEFNVSLANVNMLKEKQRQTRGTHG